MAELGLEDEVRRLIGVALSGDELAVLVRQYASQARAVAAFPEGDLKQVEPPLRSTPGPMAEPTPSMPEPHKEALG